MTQGNLLIERLEIRTQDEFYDLTRDINKIHDKFKEFITEIKKMALNVSSSSHNQSNYLIESAKASENT